MSPAEVAEYLAVMRAAGALELNLSDKDGRHLSVKLGPEPVSAAPFVDSKGHPVNLDEGAPWNTREPEDSEAELYRANFPGKQAPAEPAE